jgi:hypothetical protein
VNGTTAIGSRFERHGRGEAGAAAEDAIEAHA